MYGSLKEGYIDTQRTELRKLGERHGRLQAFEKRWDITYTSRSRKPSGRRVLFLAPPSGYCHILSVSVNHQCNQSRVKWQVNYVPHSSRMRPLPPRIWTDARHIVLIKPPSSGRECAGGHSQSRRPNLVGSIEAGHVVPCDSRHLVVVMSPSNESGWQVRR